jgi:TPR repeat protein/type IV secretory pathway TraG/TraD family ATPase VirD4
LASDSIVEHSVTRSSPNAPLGTAQWMPSTEALEKFAFDDGLFALNDDGLWEGRSNGQIWVGETFDREPVPIGYRDDRHVLLVSGTRGGKGTGVIIPNLCLWPGSAIVIDPKGENATVTARRRGEGSDYAYGLGQTVRILDPFGEVQFDPSLKARYNPLDAVDPKSDFAVDDAGRIAAAIVVVENRNDPFWEQAARNLVKALILHVLTARNFEGRRNLVSVWRLLRQGDWLTVDRARKAGQEKIPSGFTLLWHGMKRNEAYNGLIAGEAEQMLDMHERTRSGILKVATTATEFIDGPPMQRLLEASDFDLAAIKTDPKGLTLYLTLPQRYMSTHFRWLRLMISLAVGEMEQIKARPATGHPTLFLLDEFAGLQRMETVENAAAQAAGFGVKFFFVLQNLPQLKEIYNDSWETFLGNSGLRLFFQIDDNFTRAYLAQQLGEREVVRQSRSGSRSDTTSSSTTDGRSSSNTTGSSFSTTDGKNAGESLTKTTGTSIGDSITYRGLLGFWPQSRNYQGGANRSRARSRSFGWSTSKSDSRSRSISDSTSFSRSASLSRSITEGWGEAIHKRLLLNPDEIGRFLARIDDPKHPAHPGVVLVLIPGEHPLPVHRVNYFASHWFDAFFDPHPDHPAPPTIAERIQLIAASKLKTLPPPARRRSSAGLYAAGACAGLIVTGLVAWLVWSPATHDDQVITRSNTAAAPPPPPSAPALAPQKNSAATLPIPSSEASVSEPGVESAPFPPSSASAVEPRKEAAITLAPPSALAAPSLPPPVDTISEVLKAGDHARKNQNYEEAVRWYRKAADRGSAQAQTELGHQYRKGEGVPKDPSEALRWYLKAADQGLAEAEAEVGELYMGGEGIAENDAEAIRWLRKGVDQGDAIAEANLGLLYLRGQGVPRDDAEAARWFRKAADQGSAVAQASLGELYANGQGVGQDYAQALTWFRKAAEQGDALGQTGLGVMYLKGQAVKRDYAEALAWFRKAADQGDPEAQSNIGTMYSVGQGVDRDYTAALNWFRKAADQGNADAQGNIGLLYFNGHGVDRDYRTAMFWLRKAADQDDPGAETAIGVMYANRLGVPRDYVEAFRWYRKAAAQGDPSGEYNLGVAYARGQGVERDMTQGRAWITKAAVAGLQPAKQWLAAQQ